MQNLQTLNNESKIWQTLNNESKIWLWFFPNLSACPTGSTSDGTKECECTATGATTDGTADCKCAENFQLNDAMTECVGKSHRIITSNKEKDFSPKKRRIRYLYSRIYKH